MPQVTIKQGDTLGALAQQYGTSVAALVQANSGNPSVKSADLIIAGGNLNIPEGVSTPASGVAAPAALGSLGGSPVQNAGSQSVSELSNFRTALRGALNEAARKRVETSFKQVAPFTEGSPGSIGSVVSMIRGSVKTPVETTFSDVFKTVSDINDARQKEQDRINELREEYGSLVPSSVTDLKTALNLIAPTVDKERKLKLDKMASEQAEDNDIDSWADSFARGEISIGNVPAKIRTQVKVRADAIRETLETEAKKEYKDRIAFRLEKKTSDFETERGFILQDDNLTVSEQRDVIDYIDSLEQAQKAAKGKKGIFSFFEVGKGGEGSSSENIYGKGNFSKISIDDRINQLKNTLGGGAAGATKNYLESQLIKDGYDPNTIKSKTRSGLLDFLK